MPISQEAFFLISMPNSAITVSRMHIPSKTHFKKAVEWKWHYIKLYFKQFSLHAKNFFKQFQYTGKQAFSSLTMEFWHCFVFWKQYVYLTIKNQVFNRHSLPLSVRKMSRRIVLRLSQTNAKNQLSEPIDWPLRHSQKGQFSLSGRCGLYRRD